MYDRLASSQDLLEELLIVLFRRQMQAVRCQPIQSVKVTILWARNPAVVKDMLAHGSVLEIR